MPRVPRVSEQPGGGVGQFQAFSPIPFRDQRAGQIQQFGESQARLGSQVARFANTVQEEIDTAYAKDRANIAGERLRQRLHDPETGYLQTRGEGAIKSRKETLEKIDKELDQLRGTLENDAQRANFSRVADVMRERALLDVDSHYAVESRNFLVSRIDATIDQAKQQAVEDGDWRVLEGRVRREVDQLGELSGAPAEVVKQTYDDHIADAARDRAAQLEDHDDLAAFLQEQGPKMRPQERKQAQERLKKLNVREVGIRAAESAMSAGGSLQEQRERVRKLRDTNKLSLEAWLEADDRILTEDARRYQQENRAAVEAQDDARNTYLEKGEITTAQAQRLSDTGQMGFYNAWVDAQRKPPQTSTHGQYWLKYWRTREGKAALGLMSDEEFDARYLKSGHFVGADLALAQDLRAVARGEASDAAAGRVEVDQQISDYWANSGHPMAFSVREQADLEARTGKKPAQIAEDRKRLEAFDAFRQRVTTALGQRRLKFPNKTDRELVSEVLEAESLVRFEPKGKDDPGLVLGMATQEQLNTATVVVEGERIPARELILAGEGDARAQMAAAVREAESQLEAKRAEGVGPGDLPTREQLALSILNERRKQRLDDAVLERAENQEMAREYVIRNHRRSLHTVSRSKRTQLFQQKAALDRQIEQHERLLELGQEGLSNIEQVSEQRAAIEQALEGFIDRYGSEVSGVRLNKIVDAALADLPEGLAQWVTREDVYGWMSAHYGYTPKKVHKWAQ